MTLTEICRENVVTVPMLARAMGVSHQWAYSVGTKFIPTTPTIIKVSKGFAKLGITITPQELFKKFSEGKYENLH